MVAIGHRVQLFANHRQATGFGKLYGNRYCSSESVKNDYAGDSEQTDYDAK
jgi:hypothetical protein